MKVQPNRTGRKEQGKEMLNSRFQIYHPEGILKNFVDSIVYLNGIGTGISFQRMYQTIIINLETNFEVSQVYGKPSDRKLNTDTIWINGKQEIPMMIESRGSTKMFVIGLKTGMLPFIAKLPAFETNELAVGWENWSSREIVYLREQLLECADVHSGFLLIEKYFTGLIAGNNFPNLDKVLWLNNAIKKHSVNEICSILGTTRKTLRRDSQTFFGGSVKNIQGIIRFNNTLATIANNSEETLSLLHPYYDQSHFINDFKVRSGITPLKFKRLCQQYSQIKNSPNFIPLERETFLQFIALDHG